MCGRYVSPDDTTTEREFNLVHSPGFVGRPSYNVAPTQLMPVVRAVGGVRKPFYIHCVDQDVHGYAGLWDSSTREDGTSLESFTIITMPAHSMMAEIHNAPDKQRMPVILDRKDYEAWLSGTPEEARAVLKQYPADSMLAWPVSTRVGSPKNNDARLIEAI